MVRDREEGKVPGGRWPQDEEFLDDETESGVLTLQGIDTLREGYSWVRALERRHPGWRLIVPDSDPFAAAKQPAVSKACLVSFAGVYLRGQKPFSISPGMVPSEYRKMNFRDRGDWSVHSIPRDCNLSDLAVSHRHYDHAEADEDINCVFPLARLKELALDGVIGECADDHYSLMGYVPQVQLIVQTALQHVIPALRKQGVDLVVVSGGCALSHYSAGLIQREIEAAGIPTVAVSVCPDISERLRVPRAAALRFPLGNPFGAALDHATQSRILKDVLALVEKAQPGSTVIRLPYDWGQL